MPPSHSASPRSQASPSSAALAFMPGAPPPPPGSASGKARSRGPASPGRQGPTPAIPSPPGGLIWPPRRRRRARARRSASRFSPAFPRTGSGQRAVFTIGTSPATARSSTRPAPGRRAGPARARSSPPGSTSTRRRGCGGAAGRPGARQPRQAGYLHRPGAQGAPADLRRAQRIRRPPHLLGRLVRDPPRRRAPARRAQGDAPDARTGRGLCPGRFRAAAPERTRGAGRTKPIPRATPRPPESSPSTRR